MRSLFVHSLFRSCSTYFYSVFAKNNDLACFQEALHEVVFKNKDTPTELTRHISATLNTELRHPSVEYWNSLVEIWPSWVDAIDLRSPIEYYFSGLNDECGAPYFEAIINEKDRDCVFFETRTSGRINALKKSINNSNHVLIFRNPWDQWWSYHVNKYFFSFNQQIFNGSRSNSKLYALKELIAERNIDIESMHGKYILFIFYGYSATRSINSCEFIEHEFIRKEEYKKATAMFELIGIHNLDFLVVSFLVIWRDRFQIFCCQNLLYMMHC